MITAYRDSFDDNGLSELTAFALSGLLVTEVPQTFETGK